MGIVNKQIMVTLPLATITGAYLKFSGDPRPPTDKSVMIQWLDGQIDAGKLTLSLIHI